MRFPERHYRWSWRLHASPAALWPLVADTNRFNRDTGLPAVVADGNDGADGMRRRLRFARFGLAVAWEEAPFEWLRPYRFGVLRRYRAGPVATMRVRVELHPLPGGGTRLRYSTGIRARNLLGAAGIPIVMAVSRRRFGAVFRRYDREAARPCAGPPTVSETARPGPIRLAPGGEGRLEAARRTLLDGGADPALVERLLATLAQGDELTLAHLRPYALADGWGASRRAALELCLRATRAGLLDLQWDVLCPLCRGAKQSATHLAGLDDAVHCATCNIDFSVNFDRAVELTFRPNGAVRSIEVGEFCVGGPQVTPHIVAQQLLAPGERREVALPLEAGRYRVRALGQRGGQYLLASESGAPAAAITVAPDGWPDGETKLSLQPRLTLRNATAQEQLLILERMAWTDQAATAAEVTALQVFRDLFSSEVLRRDQCITVGSLTVLFTDLRASTRLYQAIGDAPAFGRVLDHFAVLGEAVAGEGGAIVKTIGDAIMAVFPRPVAALRAMLTAQRRLAEQQTAGPPLYLKAGIHAGPCIAVTLNERLDYFGTVVNLASRLERFSTGEDVIVSDIVRCDPEVAALLAGPASGLVAEPFAGQLKGFEDQQFRLWRVHAIPER
jgi:class 3 adenylate cyclase